MTATGADLLVLITSNYRTKAEASLRVWGHPRLNDKCGSVQAYPRENAGGLGGVRGQPPRAGRHPPHARPKPQGPNPAGSLGAAHRDGPVRVPEPAARNGAAWLEPENPASARRGRPIVQLVARTW